MKLFKQRLLELIALLAGGAIVLGIFAGGTAFLNWLHPAIAPVIFLLFLIVAVIAGAITFINWLLVEPFRKGRGVMEVKTNLTYDRLMEVTKKEVERNTPKGRAEELIRRISIVDKESAE